MSRLGEGLSVVFMLFSRTLVGLVFFNFLKLCGMYGPVVTIGGHCQT